MIELVNVSKVYQETHALKNIHFSVQPGEIVGIVGKKWLWQVHVVTFVEFNGTTE